MDTQLEQSPLLSFSPEQPISIPCGEQFLTGGLAVPAHPRGVVLIASIRGCRRRDPDAREQARLLYQAGLALVRVDLLTPEELADRTQAAQLSVDAVTLAERIELGRQWIGRQPGLAHLPLGLIGEEEAASAALFASEVHPRAYAAVVGGVWPQPLGTRSRPALPQ